MKKLGYKLEYLGDYKIWDISQNTKKFTYDYQRQNVRASKQLVFSKNKVERKDTKNITSRNIEDTGYSWKSDNSDIEFVSDEELYDYFNESLLYEDTLNNINNKIINALISVGCTILNRSVHNDYLIFKTPAGTKCSIPITSKSSKKSADYNKLVYNKSGKIIDGEVYDTDNNYVGKAYVGKKVSHTHHDYSDNIDTYEVITPNNKIGFTAFINNVKKGII